MVERVITIDRIKERGWTDSAIKRFLGKPDEEKPNPFSRKHPTTKLYSEKRVAKIETTEAFKVWRKTHQKRKIAGKKRVEKNHRKFLDSVRGHSIDLPQMEDRALTLAAINYFNERLERRAQEVQNRYDQREAEGEYEDPDFHFEFPYNTPVSFNSDPGFLNRIKVNYLQNVQLDYDAVIDQISYGLIITNKIKTEGKAILRHKVYRKIVETYPDLQGEANRQIEEWRWRYFFSGSEY